MEQGVLSHQYFSQKPIQFPPRSLSLNIDVNSGRNRCNSADSIHETSGYSSATTSLDDTYSMKEPNPFFGTFNTQSYTSTRKPISSAYYPHSSGQRGHNQTDINEYEQRSQSEVSPTSDGSLLASDDDMGYSPTTSDSKTPKGRKSRKPPKSNKSSKDLLSTTEKCKVCLAQAARHVHYGATTCYSCKAFFRRSIQLGAAFKYTCQTQGNCVMLPNTRKSCQRCRFDRCLSIGMKPDKVLTEKQRAKRFRKVRQKGVDVSKDVDSPSTSKSDAAPKISLKDPREISNFRKQGLENKQNTHSAEECHATYRGMPKSSITDGRSYNENEYSFGNKRTTMASKVDYGFPCVQESFGPSQSNIFGTNGNFEQRIFDYNSSESNEGTTIKIEPRQEEQDRHALARAENMETERGDEHLSYMTSPVPSGNSNISTNIVIKTERDDFTSQTDECPSDESNQLYNSSYTSTQELNIQIPPSHRRQLHENKEHPFNFNSGILETSYNIVEKKSSSTKLSSLAAPSIYPSSIFKEKDYSVNGCTFSEVPDLSTPNKSNAIDLSTTSTLTPSTTSLTPISSVLPISNSNVQKNGVIDEREGQYKENTIVARISTLFSQAGNDDIMIVQKIVTSHEIQYKSINFGEDVIKEMIMSSVFGIPVSAKAAMTAYRLMIQRVARVAQNFSDFLDLPTIAQTTLLKNNADMIVSLRGAVFFEMKKQGLDQILSSLGIDDLQAAREMIFATLKCHNTLKHIDYKTFNTIQDKAEGVMEKRYDQLLEQIGATIAFNPNIVILFSYILLFSLSRKDFDSLDEFLGDRILRIHDMLIGLMERYLYAIFSNDIAKGVFSAIMNCVEDLRELTLIKKKRQISASLATKPPEEAD